MIQAYHPIAQKQANDVRLAETTLMLAVLSQRVGDFAQSGLMFLQARAYALGTNNETLLMNILCQQSSVAFLSNNLVLADELSHLPLRFGNLKQRVSSRITKGLIAEQQSNEAELLKHLTQNFFELKHATNQGYLTAHNLLHLSAALARRGNLADFDAFAAFVDDFAWSSDLSRLHAETHLNIAAMALYSGRRALLIDSLTNARLASNDERVTISYYCILARQAILDANPRDLVVAIGRLSQALAKCKTINSDTKYDLLLLTSELATSDLHAARILFDRSKYLEPPSNRGAGFAERSDALADMALGMIELAEGNLSSAQVHLQVAYFHFLSQNMLEPTTLIALGLFAITKTRGYDDLIKGLIRERPSSSIAIRYGHWQQNHFALS